MWSWKSSEYVTKKHDFIQFLRFIIAPPLPHLWLNEIKISANFVKLRMEPELHNWIITLSNGAIGLEEYTYAAGSQYKKKTLIGASMGIKDCQCRIGHREEYQNKYVIIRGLFWYRICVWLLGQCRKSTSAMALVALARWMPLPLFLVDTTS